MEVYVSDKEQVEAARKWLRENWKTIAISTLIACVAVFGWRYWVSSKQQSAEQASYIYQQMTLAYESDDAKKVNALGEQLILDYPSTPYSDFSGLLLAKQSVDEGDLDKAKQQLIWVIAHTKDNALEQVARLRGARVQLALKKPDEALKLLATTADNAYVSVIEYLQGDAYLALNEKDKAKTLYKSAFAKLDKGGFLKSLVQIKLDQLQ